MTDDVDLLVTEERRDAHQMVLVRGKRGKLTQSSVHLLLTLAAGRADKTNSGYVVDPDVCYPVAICRLRQALQRAMRSATGKAFVETGIGKEYRLKPDLSVGVTERYASRLEKSDPRLLDKLKQADVAVVTRNPSLFSECAISA